MLAVLVHDVEVVALVLYVPAPHIVPTYASKAHVSRSVIVCVDN